MPVVKENSRRRRRRRDATMQIFSFALPQLVYDLTLIVQ